MSLNKAIEHGKEHRQQYRGSKAIDKSCRNHGSCDWCLGNRTHKNKVREAKFKDEFEWEAYMKNKPAICDTVEFIGEIIDVFEDFLEEKGVDIENRERSGNVMAAILYGSDYDSLSDSIERVLRGWKLIK